MAPSYVSRRSDRDKDIVDHLIRRAQEDPAKPWTIVSDVAREEDENPDMVRNLLRQLTLEGKLTPTADGDLRAAETTTEA